MQGRELAEGWHAFAAEAEDALRRIDPEAWQRACPYEGWTEHDLLAHLSSSQKALPRVLMSAFAPPPSNPVEPFDADRWNASQVRRRKEEGEENLIEEFRQGASEVITILEKLQPPDLDRPVPAGAGRGRALGSVLETLLAHQRRHLADLLGALDAAR